MLVQTMNDDEIMNELLNDATDTIYSAKMERAFHQYNKHRRQFSVKPTSEYPQFFPIRTERKNNWLILLRKPPADEKYNDDPCYHLYCYNWNKIGFRVYKPIQSPSGSSEFQGIGVYNGHVFTRYNERMNLKLSEPLGRMKHFFSNNGFAQI